jgi:hypothetical protein
MRGWPVEKVRRGKPHLFEWFKDPFLEGFRECYLLAMLIYLKRNNPIFPFP